MITVGEVGPPACARAAQCLERNTMARVDAIVLGAGIVGTSIGLHLAKRGLAVALVDRRAPGRDRAPDAPVVRARSRRARGAARGGRCGTFFAQDRLAQALSQRSRIRCAQT